MALDSPVWDVKWNMTGTMLAANYLNHNGKNTVAVFKSKNSQEWVLADKIVTN